LARALALFGFYSFAELLQLAQNLLAIVNTRPIGSKSRRRGGVCKLGIRKFTTKLDFINVKV
jgi:hypothetical protein